MTELVTSRLRLRRFAPDDAPALARYRSDPRVARHQAWRTPIDRAQAAAVIAGYRTEEPDRPGFFQYAIELLRHPGLIGDLFVATEADGTQAAVGITLTREVHHRGYATEALTAVTDRLLASGVRRVRATCDARNTASARLLRRVGFEQCGRESQYLELRGVHADVLLFEMSARSRAGSCTALEEPAGDQTGTTGTHRAH
ncbi:GNAT family N-acetyltransferase [Kitasatospora viridis]|uniref:RimJ/RimL family protein N-acetyltransferase n=1 Tax=Kitasatospora viridis TaxID=281105 RepID=A0A561ULA7_9ACTN|nr:GNAT family N-acetyltransferase [Kitasatospora viridis]TWG00148.1 RimJ/RimL family protein N-acetyltransferase [Kitasatospora viridis]